VGKLRRGGLAALQGMLHVGDTILAVEGAPLKGERVVSLVVWGQGEDLDLQGKPPGADLRF